MKMYDYIIKLISSNAPDDRLLLAALVILWVSSLVIAGSVIYKFVIFRDSARDKKGEKFHVVETFSMAAVIIIFFNILQTGFGSYRPVTTTWLLLEIFGGLLAALAVQLHLWSKLAIGKFWSNNIEILKDHKLVTHGPYAIVRHPMYSSIIMWMVAMSMIFVNPGALAFTLAVFVPMMVFRATAEDRMLKELDPAGFEIYKSDTYQLVPKYKGTVSMALRLSVIIILAYTLILREMDTPRFVALFLMHFIAGLISYVPKVRFSYMNKSFIMLIIYIFTLFFPQAFWAYYMILVFDIYGLFLNCPCMWIYEKYNGCPCFSFLKKCVYRK